MTQAEQWKQDYQHRVNQPHQHTEGYVCCFGDLMTKKATCHFRLIDHRRFDHSGLWVFPDESAIFIDVDKDGNPPLNPPCLILQMVKR